MREDTTSRTEADAAHAAAILGRSEHIGGGAEFTVPTPRYASPAWWCPKCDSPQMVGVPEDKCHDCGWEREA